jgi:hypothetical protein
MHFGGHLRDAFCDWVEEGMPPLVECEEHYEPITWTAEQLLGRMCHCTDIMAAGTCDQLGIEPGSTYARAAQRLLAERKQFSAVA